MRNISMQQKRNVKCAYVERYRHDLKSILIAHGIPYTRGEYKSPRFYSFSVRQFMEVFFSDLCLLLCILFLFIGIKNTKWESNI